MIINDMQSVSCSSHLDDKQGAARLEPAALGKTETKLVLPARDTKRWSSRRKAAVVVAIRTGVLSREEACERYLISDEELALWEAAFDQSGIPGLRISSLRYRRGIQQHGTGLASQR
jgi:Protein of unknown function (DUF1153)